jgi:hypothetical protein
VVALTVPTGKSAGSPPSLEALAAAQRDLLTVVQLRMYGLSDSAISKRVARGTLHRRHRGVYSLGPAPLDREAAWLAAVLAAGPGSALSHLSAAQLQEIGRLAPLLIAVVSPRVRALKGVKVHRCRRLDPRDVTTHKGIPVTTIHRLFVDLSDELVPGDLAHLMHEAAFRGRFVEPAIRDSMARANGRRSLHVVEEAIALVNSGSAGYRSRAERTFANIPSLGDPSHNTHVAGVEVDFHWPESALVVEIDGTGHGRPVTRREDRLKERILRNAGYEVVRFTVAEVEEEPERVRARLSARRPTPSSSCASRPA